MTKDKALKMALAALVKTNRFILYGTESEPIEQISEQGIAAITAIKEVLPQPEQTLQDIEQYRMQMAAICTAALGYWKNGDNINPDSDTQALRDVAKLYEKYDALYQAAPDADTIIARTVFMPISAFVVGEALAHPEQEPVAWLFQHEETGLTECVDRQQVEWGFEKNNPLWKKIAPLYTSPKKGL